MSVISRFAPSPTGFPHMGNIRTATIAWLAARKVGGTFILRLDDTDLERSKQEYADAIDEDLKWLGLTWDKFARQSDRMVRYTECIEKLKKDGRLYACYETAEELSLKRKTLLAQSKPPIYDRSALKLTDVDRAKLEAEGRKPHWRFMMKHEPIVWDDLVRGQIKFSGADISDPVLIREDGSPLYHLCSVIDDVDFNVTHIVRGEDHIANTASHIQMFEALGAKPPHFAHLSLLQDVEGGKLSKRLGSLSVKALREEEGLEPMAILSLMAKLGTSDSIELRNSLDELVKDFDFSKFSRASAKLNPEDIYRLNTQLIHEMPYAKAKERLAQMGLGEVDEVFWNSVRGNLTKFADITEWWRVAKEPLEPNITDAQYLAQAVPLLPEGEWDANTWSVWVDGVKQATGRKGKELFMPLRQALTGLEHGPELKDLLPLIGRERALKRLAGQKA